MENWKDYSGYDKFNAVYYAFLTLDNAPNADQPQDKQWDGSALYETMTLAPVEEVMTQTEPQWNNQYEWQRSKMQQVIDDCAARGSLFMWGIGGWSDLTRTISDDQIPLFVEKVVNLLRLGGDGVDFDWEHLSTCGDSGCVGQQRALIGKTITALRAGLNANGLSDKHISYTTRWQCFWSSEDASRYDALPFASDGECLDTLSNMPNKDDISWINLMMYDAGPGSAFNGAQHFDFNHYKTVLEAGAAVIDRKKIVMGFEPGNQAVGGIWEGFDLDFQVIDYMKQNGYGGVFFWAINEAASNQNSGTPTSAVHSWQGNTGRNSQYIAERAMSGVPTPSPRPTPVPPTPVPTPTNPTPSPSPTGQCHSISAVIGDDWCMANCLYDPPFCPDDMCACDGHVLV